MVDDSVLICVLNGDLRPARGKTRPYFTADKATVAVLVEIVDPIGDAYRKTCFQIVFCCTVFCPVSDDIVQPIFRKNIRSQSLSTKLCCTEPNKLKVKIIIRENTFRQIVGVVLDRNETTHTLEGYT